jgi:hypothetical protein
MWKLRLFIDHSWFVARDSPSLLARVDSTSVDGGDSAGTLIVFLLAFGG